MEVPEEYERTSSLLVISIVSPQDDTVTWQTPAGVSTAQGNSFS